MSVKENTNLSKKEEVEKKQKMYIDKEQLKQIRKIIPENCPYCGHKNCLLLDDFDTSICSPFTIRNIVGCYYLWEYVFGNS